MVLHQPRVVDLAICPAETCTQWLFFNSLKYNPFLTQMKSYRISYPFPKPVV